MAHPLPLTNVWNVNNQEGDQQRGDPINLAPHASTPITSYYDRMSLLFSQWYPAFIILQSIMGLTRIELLEVLREGIGIEPNETTRQQNSASHNPEKSHSNMPTTAKQHSTTNSNHGPSRRRENLGDPLNRANNHPPLSGANTIPLPQRSREDQSYRQNNIRLPLLPTPEDPFCREGRKIRMGPPVPPLDANSLSLNHSPLWRESYKSTPITKLDIKWSYH